MDGYLPAAPLTTTTPFRATPVPPAPPPIPEGRLVELMALVAIVALLDVAVYRGTGGAGIAALLVGISALALLASKNRRVSARFAAVALLVLAVAGRALWEGSLGTALVGASLVLAFAITLRGARTYVPELVVSSLGSAFGSFQQLWAFGASAIRLSRPSRLARVRWLVFVVPLVLVVVFGAVFVAANPVIRAWTVAALAHLPSLAWFPSPLRFIFWAVCALAAAAVLRPVCRTIPWLDARLGTDHATHAAGEVTGDTRLAIARNVMIALNALFLVNNGLDAVYLWAGRAPAGVSHTEYAHSGAAWLTVAVVLSTIVLSAIFRGAIQHDVRARLTHVLAYAWAAQNFVLAMGTFRRIQMYVAYSGLTDLRILGVFGTALSTVGLAIVVLSVARRRAFLWVLRRQLDALAIAAVLYVVTPSGWIAMRYNVARVQADQYRPLLHLFQQRITPEAAPEMLPLLEHPDPVVRQGVAVLLAGRRTELDAQVEAATIWPEWEASRAHARDALTSAHDRIVAASPADPVAAYAKLRGVAYGINDEVEREGDEGPFDWRRNRYPSRY
jgi:hypothetical protein